MQTNIYRITNNDSGSTYLGQTTQKLETRCSQHRRALARGDHWNDNFQADFDAGNKSLSIERLATIIGTKKVLSEVEMRYVRREARCYNIKTGARGAMTGRTFGFAGRGKLKPQYDYADIRALKGKLKTREIAEEFGIGVPMVYMIMNGDRIEQQPAQTSFADVVRCLHTLVKVPV